MKKYFAFLTIALVALSCQQEPEEEPYIRLSTKQQTLSSEQNSISVTVESNKVWTASADVFWLSLSSNTGESGETQITISVNANENTDSRSARIVFSCATASDTLDIFQAQKDKFELTSAKSYNIGKSATQLEITYRSNVQVEASVDVDWIRQAESKGMVSGVVLFDIDANDSYDRREGTITVRGAATEYQIPVIQQQSNGIILSETSVELEPEGGNFQVEVNSNVDYKVSYPVLGWVSRPSTKGLIPHTEYFTASGNMDYDPRSTEIIFYCDDVSDTLRVVQKERIGFFMDSEYRQVPSTGETISVRLDRNVDYSTQVSDSWIQPVPATKGLVSETLQFNVLNNDEGEERDGNIRFTPSKGEPLTLYVHQDFTPVVEIVGVKAHKSPMEGDSFDIKINANVPYDVVSSADWVTVDSSNKVSVAANSEYDARQATITFKNLRYGTTDTFEITQDARIGFFVGAGQKSVKAEGETISVELQYNVGYTVTISDTWIRQLPATKGLVSESLQFKVDANTGSSERSGYIAFESELGGFKDTLFVFQNFKPVLVLDGASSVEISSAACVLTPEIRANVKYTTSADMRWITVKEDGTLSIAQNTTFFARTGVVTWAWENTQYKLSASLTIKQSGIDHNTLVYTMNGKKLALPAITGTEQLDGYVDWGDGSATVGYSAGMTHTYDASGNHTVTIILINNDTVTFDDLDALTSLDLSKF